MLRFPFPGTGNFAAPSAEHIWESWQRGGGVREGGESLWWRSLWEVMD